MIKLPFGRKPKEDIPHRPSTAFALYCREELERLHDSGEPFDEARFAAAVDLAESRLKALDEEDKA
ncbi:MAG: hypothetical protein U9Q81_11470 [Pseudomonadota bacterium]|nr:hypothetical protein [Pseudomonadota bacterium]